MYLGPIHNFLKRYAQKKTARFHMPGHKGKTNSLIAAEDFLQYDITEIAGADNLLMPSGIILEAQQQAAEAFGAQETYFLTQGSTGAILAMFLSLGRNAKILISRDCHKSVVSALALSGHDCAFICPEIDADALVKPVQARQIVEALDRQPDITAVFITRPDYYGRCADIQEISRVCKRRGALLLVDEAHGAHLNFCTEADHPKSAASYADMCAQSAHKTLRAMTQAAYFHVNYDNANMPSARKIKTAISLVQTTSPSYLILASLDSAWRNTQADNWNRHVARVNEWARASQHQELFLQQHGGLMPEQRDTTRVVMDVSKYGLTGFEAQHALQKKNIEIEMADARRMVCITTPADDDAWYHQLECALGELPRREGFTTMQPGRQYALPPKAMRIREAVQAQCEENIPLSHAQGRISASTIGIYPPGIALIFPGEIITREIIAELTAQQSMGASIFGLPLACVAL